MGILFTYSFSILGVSLFGAKLSSWLTLTPKQIRTAMGLIAGFIIGITCHYVFPSGLYYIGGSSAYSTAYHWMLGGITMMVLLCEVFKFHKHDIVAKKGNKTIISHSSLWGIILGMLIHSLMEGIILGTSIQSSWHHGSIAPGGFGIFLIILIHKPLDIAAILGAMKVARKSISSQKILIVLFSLTTPLTCALIYWGKETLIANGYDHIIGYAMAFSAGTLLSIAMSDLLPEVQSRGKDKGKLFITFMIGLSLSYILCLF